MIDGVGNGAQDEVQIYPLLVLRSCLLPLKMRGVIHKSFLILCTTFLFIQHELY